MRTASVMIAASSSCSRSMRSGWARSFTRA
jgi:hypothetical protein